VAATRQVQPDVLRERLTATGLRPTRQRLRVLEELAREPHDATAQQLFGRLRDGGERIGLATVYRTLRVLAEHGVVDVLVHNAEESCYRVCSDEHHHHLVCTGCHRVVELADCDLDEWLHRMTAAVGFVPTAHQVEVAGLCADCR
jgi:Fur family transcriptional regulator, ferric uptake regulator